MIRVVIDGEDLGDDWEKFDGGDTKAKEVKNKPGKMGKEVSLGGPKSVTTITVSRAGRLNDKPLQKRLRAKTGDATALVTETTLDRNGAVYSGADASETFSGVLIEVNRPTMDSNATAATRLELVISPNEDVV